MPFSRSCYVYFPRLLLAVVVVIASGAAVAQETPNNAAVRDFNAAAALQNSGLHARAADKWAAFVKKYPTDSRLDRANYFLGICQLHAKKFPEAVASFQTVLSKYPNFAKADGAQYNLGMAYYQLAAASKKPEDFKKAATELGTVASKYAASRYAHGALYMQGESLYAAADLKDAVGAYKKLVAAKPSDALLADAYYALGTTEQELGLDADAAATFKAFLDNGSFANHELATEIRLRIAMSLFAEKKYTDAQKHFETVAAVADFPRADFALLRLGQCRLEAGNVAEATDRFAQLLQKFPNSTYKGAAQLAAGKCYYLGDKPDDARKALEPLVAAKQEQSAEAAYWLGRSLLKLDKPADALKVLDDAVKTFTAGEFVAYLQAARADALYDLPDRRKEALPLYQAFLQQHAEHPLASQALYMTALAALGQEDYDTARKQAEAFLAKGDYAAHELRPAVLYVAAESYLLPAGADGGSSGDLAKAEQLYRELIAKHPEHSRVARAHLRIGWCLFRSEKHDDSINYLKGNLAKLSDPAHVAEAQLLLARSYGATDRHGEAVTACDAALSAKADWSRADEVLAAAAPSLRVLAKPADARARLERLIADFPQSTYRAQALYQLGEIAQDEKKYDEAIARYQEVLNASPDDELAAASNYALGSAYLAKEDYDKAVEALGKVISDNTDAAITARARYLRGLVYQRQDKFAEAVQDIEAYLKTNPTGDETLDARYTLVLCLIGQKQFAPATAALEALLKDKPDYVHAANVYYELGHAQLQEKKLQEAAAAFRTLAEKTPESPLVAESWFHVGRAHEEAAVALNDASQQSAEIAKAAVAFAAGLAKVKEPTLKEKLQYKLGDVQFQQEKFAEAATILQAQLAEHPTGDLAGPGRYLTAESLFRQDKFAEAMPLFVKVAEEKGEKIEKYHADSLYRAGTCAGKLQKWPESQKHFETLIAQFAKYPQVSDARYGLGVALNRQQKRTEAKAAFEQVTEETETETAARARYMIGEIAFVEKKYEDAVVEFLTVAAGYPYKQWQARAQLEAGRCLIALGRKEKAATTLQVVVDKYSDQPEAQDAAKLIQSLKP
ncbi:MAG: tetratricopeptide repeat protein [Candidatus Nealsonbacteria bacterium]|nr:tetratricopeptide repeat protein [Candidatus Nealsonbacteria bacterium]